MFILGRGVLQPDPLMVPQYSVGGGASAMQGFVNGRFPGLIWLHQIANATSASLSDSRLETFVRLVHIKSELSNLLWAKLFRCPHLIQRDQPLNDLASIVKILVCDFVDGLDNITKKWV
jgi:hypothetical protein